LNFSNVVVLSDQEVASHQSPLVLLSSWSLITVLPLILPKYCLSIAAKIAALEKPLRLM
jgi:hypothetical protein